MSEGPNRFYGRGNTDMMDYKLVLFRHMALITQLRGTKPIDGKDQRLINITIADMVNMFEAMLNPYFDKEYKENAKKIVDDPGTHDDDKEYALKKYSALITLLARKRLLPVEEMSVEEE